MSTLTTLHLLAKSRIRYSREWAFHNSGYEGKWKGNIFKNNICLLLTAQWEYSIDRTEDKLGQGKKKLSRIHRKEENESENQDSNQKTESLPSWRQLRTGLHQMQNAESDAREMAKWCRIADARVFTAEKCLFEPQPWKNINYTQTFMSRCSIAMRISSRS